MILGCLLLVLVLQRYEFKTKVTALGPADSAVTRLANRAAIPEILSTVRL
jgi:hypothetical protein